MREPIDVVGRAFSFGTVLIELRTINPLLGHAFFTKGTVVKRHQVAQSEQADRLQPAQA